MAETTKDYRNFGARLDNGIMIISVLLALFSCPVFSIIVSTILT